MTNNYLRHPAYADYPVVGVSWIQAVEFSKWRTDRVNEHILETEGFTKRGARITDVDASTTFNTQTYLTSPTDAYGGNTEITQGGRTSERNAQRDSTNLYVQLKDGLLLPDYRLPTEAEWEYAALGLGSLRSYNVYRGKKNIPGMVSTPVLEKEKHAGINWQTLNKEEEIMEELPDGVMMGLI